MVIPIKEMVEKTIACEGYYPFSEDVAFLQECSGRDTFSATSANVWLNIIRDMNDAELLEFVDNYVPGSLLRDAAVC